ncbi:MAG TPA: hypothetical protein VEA80_03065 [Vitreimonas sp.]|uniref:hypothetical protein n=1 Tax=Vitreimonas sp. TaxID=3069702 RepID=UPI002D57A07A|nr:hypothetical protein [Vitreimonas sp.]HYD86433.1 hypothetical protein [Vitreimonas sp.]
MTMRRRGSLLSRTFGVPALIAAFSSVGLIAALIGDGALDLLSWIGLGVPVAAIAWAVLFRRS